MGIEDVVVFRLEGVGPFAVPLRVLDDYLVPAAAADRPLAPFDEGSGALGGFEPVPIILEADFLRGRTTRRDELVIDQFGCVGLPDRSAVFER
jgi:hypothetical protein